MLKTPRGVTMTLEKVSQSLAPPSKSVTIPPRGGLPKVTLGKITKTCGEKGKKGGNFPLRTDPTPGGGGRAKSKSVTPKK